MKFDPQSGYLVDEPEVLAERHNQPQLRITDIGRGIEAPIARAQDQLRRRRQRLVRNQQINVLAGAQAEIAEGQHRKRCALDEQYRLIGIVEQTLCTRNDSQAISRFSRTSVAACAPISLMISGGTSGRTCVSPS